MEFTLQLLIVPPPYDPWLRVPKSVCVRQIFYANILQLDTIPSQELTVVGPVNVIIGDILPVGGST